MANTVYGKYLGRDLPVNSRDGTLDINALLGGIVDARKTYVYDTLKLAPGATVANTPYEFFATPVGQPDPYNGNLPKTELDTNMRKSREFSPPYDMIVNNLGFYFVQGGLLFDMQQILTLGFMEFKILEKRMWAGHLWRHPPGVGIQGASTRWFESAWTNGVPHPAAIWHFGDYKKYIPPSVSFSLTLSFPETYGAFYNSVGVTTNLPASVLARLGAIQASLATLTTQANGGNGIQLIAILNGVGNAPVQ